MFSSIFGPKKPSYAKGGKFFPLTKGYNLDLAGNVSGDTITNIDVNRYSVKPTDYNGISPIPKVVVEVGDEVAAGDTIFFDKKRPDIKYAAPVSGEVVEIRRGAKRAITDVIILADKANNYRKFNAPSLNSDRETIVNFLTESGAWMLLNQRPFDIVPGEDVIPRDIFISTFDTSPLAVDSSIALKGNEAHFQKGLDVLSKLTSGKVHLGIDGMKQPSAAILDAQGVEKNYFAGPHPAGNVGVHIHHVAPIRSGDVVWTAPVEAVITIGKLFNEGIYDVSRIVKIAGYGVEKPMLVKTFAGASIADLTKNNIKSGNQRIISGNVLTGRKVDEEGFLSYQDNLVSVIAEGDKFELFGWLLPTTKRPSISGTLPNFLYGSKNFKGETNTHGEKRAFVVTGEYESVLPMDLFPQHLFKAILTNNFEKMEGLGLTELTEEDVALCEFVCTSKMPIQQILRNGLDQMREQL